jgi:hypothetical protein
MASSVIDPLASALAAVVSGISGLSNGVTVKGIKWAPRDTDVRPAGVVEMPTVRRTDPDAPEDHLGANDWAFEFPVSFYFDLAEPAFSQAQATEILEAFIKAVDGSLAPGQPLNGLSGVSIADVKVVESIPELSLVNEQNERWAIAYLTRVQLLTFVP